MHVLVDQVGYEAQEPKQAIVSTSPHETPQEFALVDSENSKIVLKGSLQRSGQVNRWGETGFWIADFSSWKTPGHYILRVSSRDGETSSCPFAIEENILERNTLSNVVFYFKGQRASGLFDKADQHLKLPGSQGASVDVHGGWYDATGDYGIHLSHQNLTSYFNPQQTPLVLWSLLQSYELLTDRHDDNFSEYERRMLDEGLYGADFESNGQAARSLSRSPRPAKKSSPKIERSAIRTGALESSPKRRNPPRASNRPKGRTHTKLAFDPGVESRLPRSPWPAQCPQMATIREAPI